MRDVSDVVRVLLMVKYTNITQDTSVQTLTFTAREI
jgi:hypothetical protein